MRRPHLVLSFHEASLVLRNILPEKLSPIWRCATLYLKKCRLFGALEHDTWKFSTQAIIIRCCWRWTRGGCQVLWSLESTGGDDYIIFRLLRSLFFIQRWLRSLLFKYDGGGNKIMSRWLGRCQQIGCLCGRWRRAGDRSARLFFNLEDNIIAETFFCEIMFFDNTLIDLKKWKKRYFMLSTVPWRPSPWRALSKCEWHTYHAEQNQVNC